MTELISMTNEFNEAFKRYIMTLHNLIVYSFIDSMISDFSV